MDDKNVWFWLEWLPLVCFVECNGINCGDDLYRSATYNEKESISQRYGAISMWRKNKMPVVSVFSLPLFCLVVLSSGLQWIRFQNKQSWPWYSAVHFLSLVFSCSWNLLVKPIYFVKNKMSTPKDNVLFLMFDGEKNGHFGTKCFFFGWDICYGALFCSETKRQRIHCIYNVNLNYGPNLVRVWVIRPSS